ncbi:MAG: MotA/TolQ/ExbB proton channel family protein [Fibrobacterota bacterium]
MDLSEVFYVLLSYLIKGGLWIMIPLVTISVVSWYMLLAKWGGQNRFSRARSIYLEALDAIERGETPQNRDTGFYDYNLLLQEIRAMKQGGRGNNAETLFKEFLSSAIPFLKRDLSTISVWGSVAPLLGLLGTVTGMIKTFAIITDFGLGNPNLTAQGISVALVTTQAGLTVAFPIIMLHNYIANRSNQLMDYIRLDGEDLVNRTKRWNQEK